MTVTKKEHTERLSEAYDEGLKYVILDKNNTTRHKPFRCKDYIQDVYWSEITNKGLIKQYGFKWDGDNDEPVSKQEYVTILLIPDEFNENLSPYYSNLNNFINIIEKELNIPYTKVEVSESDNKDLIVIYHNDWSKRPYLLSLLFLMLRNGLYFEGENINDVFDYLNDKTKYKNKCLENDKQQIQSLLKLKILDLLLIDKKLPKQEWNYYKYSCDIHDCSGILSFNFEEECQI